MSRSARLLQLIDLLRRARLPQAGPVLARQLDVSLRTLYRDIATLREQGAAIAGDPGVGYEMRPGFLLPPLMFTPDELEALLLGARWASRQADPELAHAATAALDRIRSALPLELRIEVDTSGLLVPPICHESVTEPWQTALRLAIRRQHRVLLHYTDEKGQPTERQIWPFAMAFFDQRRILAAWCELRQDFRHFRADRVRSVTDLQERYPDHRSGLIERWSRQLGYTVR